MNQIFLHSGHWKNDEGAVIGTWIERDINKMIIDALTLRGLLKDYTFIRVPNDINLSSAINWINARCQKNDLAITAHCNKNNDSTIRGAEAYYYLSPRLAEVFSRNVASALQIPNRGPKPDTQTGVGELGWLRKLNCDAVLVECFYMSSMSDRLVFTPEKAADGIANAIKELYPNPIKEKIGILQKLLELYQKLLEYYKSR